MSLLPYAPHFDAAAAADLARDRYGLAGVATPLPSERDQNFAVETRDGRFVLKIANRREERALLDAQTAALAWVAERTGLAPRVVPDVEGRAIVEHAGADGRYFVRLLTWVPGEPLGAVPRHAPALLQDFGRGLGEIDRALASFDHPAAHRSFLWDLATGLATVHELLPRVAAPRRAIVEKSVARIAGDVERLLPQLRRSVIHNDANDYNVIVNDRGDAWSRRTRIAGLIDFGDMLHTVTVADLAVACAYVVLHSADPLQAAAAVVRGYHAAYALTETELRAIFPFIQLRLCMSVAIAADQQRHRPDDEYLGISQAPIDRTLPRLAEIPLAFAEATFRHACGLEPVPSAARVTAWLSGRAWPPIVPGDGAPPVILDLSVGSPIVPEDPREIVEPALTSRIARAIAEGGGAVGIGRYAEPRLLYATPLFAPDAAEGERRMVHMGIDIFAPVGTLVHAPIAGIVHATSDNRAPLDYGPVIILKHETEAGDSFYTLYGHLTRESLQQVTVGQPIRSGEAFAAIGAADVNGGWTPHLHVQVMTDLLGKEADFPGVCRASEVPVWQGFSPDPNAILRITGAACPTDAIDAPAALARRRGVLGRNLSVGYRNPVKIVRGWRQYLYDASGRRYLDAYNNVPHVGHAHPRVGRAAAGQLRVLNTNTRYLHDDLARFGERLTATLPAPLRVCYFVNSGSEANELALRLARAHTSRRGLIVLDSAYHGNTTTLIDISPYKFNGPGGSGAPPWVHVVRAPDVYRDGLALDDPRAAAGYAADVTDAIAALDAAPVDMQLCGFIAETCPSVAGQLLLPPGYLAQVYASVRAAGGVCIADEVQTAYGRLGSDFYAFEGHGVVPDVVVLGKPIGNGYPLGAVITTPAIAASFDNGMEFFSTFGGSTVSCAVGLAVLDVVQEECLQAHAQRIGDVLLAGLRTLGDRYAIIGDVRGAGLFIGVELVTDRSTREPAATDAAWIVERLREEGILIGTDGPHHNVLKIRPPMPFDAGDADRLVTTLEGILREMPA